MTLPQIRLIEDGGRRSLILQATEKNIWIHVHESMKDSRSIAIPHYRAQEIINFIREVNGQRNPVCPGSQKDPREVTHWLEYPTRRANRGTCSACGRNYKLSYEEKIYKHRVHRA